MSTFETALSAVRKAYCERMDTLFRPGSRCALLDYPEHSNVGDSAIWMGEVKYLGERSVTIAYACSQANYDPKRLRSALGPEGILAIHGGGNFGDLWPSHQDFLCRVMDDFPESKIVQLPQSIHWQDQRARDRYFSRYNRHRSFHMLVRDEPSLEDFKQASPHPVALCPDSAMLLDLERTNSASMDVLALMRSDKERKRLEGFPDYPMCDWLDEPWLERARLNLGRRLRSRFKFLDTPSAYDRRARIRIARGCKILSRGRVVVTDRLHAHLLCLLMRIPHVALDNSYGKISRFRAAWTSGFPDQASCEDPKRLPEQVAALQMGILAN